MDAFQMSMLLHHGQSRSVPVRRCRDFHRNWRIGAAEFQGRCTAAVASMVERIDGEQGKMLYCKRKGTVERTFECIKEPMRFRRLKMWDLRSAEIEWQFACRARIFKRLFSLPGKCAF